MARDPEQQSHVTKELKDFHHPYTPYAIQETFMSTVYDVLEKGKVGILESPTGTVSVLQYAPHEMKINSFLGLILHAGQIFESYLRISNLVTRPQG